MKLEQFEPMFTILAIQTHASDADELTLRAYFAGLEDLEPEFVAEATKRLGRSTNAQGESWFPKLAEWRNLAIRIEREWEDQQRAILRRLPAPLCTRCKDTGWKRMSTGNVRRCQCADVRRQELLGRRQLPKQLLSRNPEKHETGRGTQEA